MSISEDLKGKFELKQGSREMKIFEVFDATLTSFMYNDPYCGSNRISFSSTSLKLSLIQEPSNYSQQNLTIDFLW